MNVFYRYYLSTRLPLVFSPVAPLNYLPNIVLDDPACFPLFTGITLCCGLPFQILYSRYTPQNHFLSRKRPFKVFSTKMLQKYPRICKLLKLFVRSSTKCSPLQFCVVSDRKESESARDLAFYGSHFYTLQLHSI